jgi:hypothetical protein
MLDAVDRGLVAEMYPDLDPSLTWQAADGTAMSSILPLESPVTREGDRVRIIAKAFYRLATGIEPEQIETTPALSRWSKFSGEEFARIIDRCLAPANSKEAITTLSVLNERAGRVRGDGLRASNNCTTVSAQPASPGGRHGLDKVAGMHALMGLRNDAGGVQRPDVVVLLPEKRTMILASKVPLIGYERLITIADESDRIAASAQFLRDVKAHIDDLAGKRYQENDTLNAHDCVLMFVPIEGALAAALTEEPNLFTYAWDRHVVLVGPSTLLMTMRTVASIWRYELQGQNAQEIARLAGELCDKLSLSLGDLNTVAERIQGALTAHNEAVKRLATGRGNAVSIGDRIRSLGVKTRRPTPAMLVDGHLMPAEAEELIELHAEN